MRRIVAITLLLVILSIAGWWFGMFQPAREQQAALEAETAGLLTEETTLTNQRDQLLALRERAPVLRDELDRLSAYIPPDPDQARLLELVQAAASASGVSFTSLSFTDPVAVPGAPPAANPALVLGSTTVLGSMDATYFQLVDFLRRLEVGSSRAILVTTVSLAEGEDGFPDLTATFSADIFSLVRAPVVATPPPGTVTPAPEAAPSPSPSPSPVTPPAAATAAPTPADEAQSPAQPVDEVQVSQGPARAGATGSPT